MEPNLNTKYYGGFWMPYSGIASPFKVTIAFAENAAANGVAFFFETAVTGFEKADGDCRRYCSANAPTLSGRSQGKTELSIAPRCPPRNRRDA